MGEGLQHAYGAARASRANPEQQKVLAVACPNPDCRAAVGIWCGDLRGGTSARLHAARKKAAAGKASTGGTETVQ